MDKNKKDSNLKQVLSYSGNKKGFVYLSWIFSAFSAILALLPFCCIWKILKDVMDAAPNYMQAADAPRFGWMALFYTALSVVCYILAKMFSYKAAVRISSNLKKEMLSHVLRVFPGELMEAGSGSIRKIINDSSLKIENYVGHQLVEKTATLVTPVGLVILMFMYDIRLGLLSLASVLIGGILLIVLMGVGLQKVMKDYQDSLDDMANNAVEYVRDIPVVKTFGQSMDAFRKFKASIERFSTFVVLYIRRSGLPIIVCTTVIYSVFAFLIGGTMVITRGGMEDGFLLNLIFYVILTPALSLMMNRFMYQSKDAIFVKDAMERIDSIMAMEKVAEAADVQFPKDASIEFKQVEFSYDGEKKALSNISLAIEAGEMVALVGPSGGGKTTLGSLASRIYEADGGEIRIGGVDIKKIPKEILMNTVSFVFQDSKLIEGTILDNVRLGRPQASREEVIGALKKAQCMDIVERLPKGIDTYIHGKGVYLSGGECQRIAIARTILMDTPILILDEATAFADPDNESRIQIALNELSKGKTVIVIAHRLSTITDVNRVVVLAEGHVAETGTVSELIETGGIFSNMWKEYNQSVNWQVN